MQKHPNFIRIAELQAEIERLSALRDKLFKDARDAEQREYEASDLKGQHDLMLSIGRAVVGQDLPLS